MKVNLILQWIWVIFIFILLIEAIFFTPLEMWAWGYTNKKLEMTMMIMIATIAMQGWWRATYRK